MRLNSWCNFETAKISTLTDDDLGVYVIWHDGSSSTRGSECVRVGHGEILNRIRAHRKDDKILSYNFYGKLKVTWALVLDKGRGLESRGISPTSWSRGSAIIR